MKSLPQLAVALCGLLAIGSSFAVAQNLPTSYSWTSTGPIISAKPTAAHDIVSVKDPSTVYYNGQYIVYASYANTAGSWGMQYLHFTNWSDAGAATPYFLDDNPNLVGYHTAPQIFYFAPQNKWYLLYQSGQAQYSTNSDPTQPQNWTAPTNLFASQPNGLDYWIICDSANCYAFFCDDGGQFYRASTPIGDFPNGFSYPEVIYSEANEGNLFEADNVYTVEGTGEYLANIECIGPDGHRFFRALWASSLGGTWQPLGNTLNESTPFLGLHNVTFDPGVGTWTNDFSSGGAVIDGYDQTDSINLNTLTFIYQGVNPADTGVSYSQLPYQLGLATYIGGGGGTCTPTPINAQMNVGGVWTGESSATVSSTTAVVDLGPQPLTGGSWSWTGPNGFTSTAREIDSIPLSTGANVYTATYTNSCGSKSTQAFTITVGTSSTLIPNGIYVFTAVNSGSALDDPDFSKTNGEDMGIWTVNDGTNQQWTVTNLSSNIITLTNVSSGQLLDVAGDSKSSGALVDQWPANGQTNQEWNVISVAGGAFELTSVNSGLALSVVGGGTANGTGVDQLTYGGSTSQQWKFTSY